MLIKHVFRVEGGKLSNAIYTNTNYNQTDMSFWGNCQYLLHQQLSFWQLQLVIKFRQNDISRFHDDVIKWKHFHVSHVTGPWWGENTSPVNSPHKGQWHGALMFSLVHAWTNSWDNNRDTGGLRRHRAHYDVPVMQCRTTSTWKQTWQISWSELFIS